MKKHIFVIRHAESTANNCTEGLLSKQKTYVIDSSFGITREGEIRAVATGKKLLEIISTTEEINESKIIPCNMYVSPYKRTRETARFLQKGIIEYKEELYNRGIEIGDLDIKYIEDPRIVEQDYGDFDFQVREFWQYISPHSYKMNQARYNDRTGRFFARLENGENLLDVYNRVSLFATTRLERSKAKINVVVTHGNTQKIFKMFFLGEPVESFEDIHGAYPNLTIMFFTYDDETGEYEYNGKF